jgi:mono/diheme cytochrome c family protein
MRIFRVGLLLFSVILAQILAHNLARAEDLEAGKSGPKLFSSNCSMCHSSPRVLAKRISNWALTDFLQNHYTASQTAANELAAYLLAVGSHSSRGKQHPIASEGDPQQANQPTQPLEAMEHLARTLVDFADQTRRKWSIGPE